MQLLVIQWLENCGGGDQRLLIGRSPTIWRRGAAGQSAGADSGGAAEELRLLVSADQSEGRNPKRARPGSDPRSGEGYVTVGWRHHWLSRPHPFLRLLHSSSSLQPLPLLLCLLLLFLLYHLQHLHSKLDSFNCFFHHHRLLPLLIPLFTFFVLCLHTVRLPHIHANSILSPISINQWVNTRSCHLFTPYLTIQFQKKKKRHQITNYISSPQIKTQSPFAFSAFPPSIPRSSSFSAFVHSSPIARLTSLVQQSFEKV